MTFRFDNKNCIVFTHSIAFVEILDIDSDFVYRLSGSDERIILSAHRHFDRAMVNFEFSRDKFGSKKPRVSHDLDGTVTLIWICPRTEVVTIFRLPSLKDVVSVDNPPTIAMKLPWSEFEVKNVPLSPSYVWIRSSSRVGLALSTVEEVREVWWEEGVENCEQGGIPIHMYHKTLHWESVSNNTSSSGCYISYSSVLEKNWKFRTIFNVWRPKCESQPEIIFTFSHVNVYDILQVFFLPDDQVVIVDCDSFYYLTPDFRIMESVRKIDICHISLASDANSIVTRDGKYIAFVRSGINKSTTLYALTGLVS